MAVHYSEYRFHKISPEKSLNKQIAKLTTNLRKREKFPELPYYIFLNIQLLTTKKLEDT